MSRAFLASAVSAASRSTASAGGLLSRTRGFKGSRSTAIARSMIAGDAIVHRGLERGTHRRGGLFPQHLPSFLGEHQRALAGGVDSPAGRAQVLELFPLRRG